MPRRTSIAICFVTAVSGGPGAVSADRTLGFTLDATDSVACRAALAPFGWVCDEFDTPRWEQVYDQPFWAEGGLSVILDDVDDDGREDLVIRVRHPAYCDDTGCYARIVFGMADPDARPRGFGFVSGGEPLRVSTRDGKPGLWYGPDRRFRPMEDVKELAQ